MLKQKKVKSKKITSLEACQECPAICCRDLAMIIGKPHTKEEIEDLKWQVRFDTVDIFIRQHHWYLRVKGKCMYLGKNNLCKIYADRPDKCKEHKAPNCERFGEYHEVLITTPDELVEYLDSKKRHKIKIK
ncbi:MAG: YkgJ family cysteine cluster protein [Candidatus Omnitrophica bacterium]|nr:YkgJ family cysteine cluster protein [Candidatus Omnitrophota bacterium]